MKKRTVQKLKYFYLTFLLTLFSFLGLFFAVTPVYATSWVRKTVDDQPDIVGQNSMVIDNEGNYLISYYNLTDSSLKFAKSTDGGDTWIASTVDGLAIQDPHGYGLYDVGQNSSIAVDSENNYLIAYWENTATMIVDLRFAKSTDAGQTWVTLLAVGDGSIMGQKEGRFVSMAVDDEDNYLAIHYDSYDNSINFAKSINGGELWTSSIIESGASASQTSIVIDTENGDYVAMYRKNDRMHLAISSNQGISWTTSEIDELAGTFDFVITPTGDYIASYRNHSEDKLKLAKSIDKGQTWSFKDIYYKGDSAIYSSIAADRSGNYFVPFHVNHWTERMMKLAQSNDGGESWNIEIADSSSASGLYTDSVVNSSGVLLIPYNVGASGNGVLKFAEATFDFAAPSLSLFPSPDPSGDTTPSLSGTATDGVNTVASVEYQVNSTSGSWTACTADDGTFDEASEDFTCTVPPGLSDGQHTIYIRATDSNGNTTEEGFEASDIFTLDTHSPTKLKLGVRLPTDTNKNGSSSKKELAGEKTLKLSSREFKLEFDTTDTTTSVKYIMVSQDKNFKNANWKEYDGDINLKFKYDGKKNVYIRLKDEAGNISDTYKQIVRVDTTPPVLKDIKVSGIDIDLAMYKMYYFTSEYPVFTGISEKGTDIKVYADNQRIGRQDDLESNTFQIQAFLPTGSHNIRVVSQDTGNNETVMEFVLVTGAPVQ